MTAKRNIDDGILANSSREVSLSNEISADFSFFWLLFGNKSSPRE
jgi:hypothetical protein